MARMATRRTFIESTAATVALEAAAVPASAAAASAYDFAAVSARLQRKARHRQVFAVAKVEGGAATGLMRHALDAYEFTRNEGAGTLHVAAVFYGRGVVMGLDDDAWRRYALADAARQRDDTVATQGEGNPFADDLRALQRRGATLLVCDNALANWATFLATVTGTSARGPDELRAELRRRLVPGALLVPAGVAALNEAQEARFTFVQASL